MLKRHYRLLYETGSELDDAVCDAFKLLGFNEIRKIRGNDKEDWIFNFKSLTNRMYGVIEVKGVKKEISKEDIQQCEGCSITRTDRETLKRSRHIQCKFAKLQG